jgi:hypothetical protein
VSFLSYRQTHAALPARKAAVALAHGKFGWDQSRQRSMPAVTKSSLDLRDNSIIPASWK